MDFVLDSLHFVGKVVNKILTAGEILSKFFHGMVEAAAQLFDMFIKSLNMDILGMINMLQVAVHQMSNHSIVATSDLLTVIGSPNDVVVVDKKAFFSIVTLNKSIGFCLSVSFEEELAWSIFFVLSNNGPVLPFVVVAFLVIC